MPRVLAVDWDASDVRCVVASRSGKKLQIHWATSVRVVNVAEAGRPQIHDIGGSLRAALANSGAGRTGAVVAVDRASVELFNLTLPPATDAELVLLVANQAMRDAPHVAEGAALDFVPLNADSSQPRAVIAAALSAERRQGIEATCAAGGVKPSRLVLRPLAAASYFLQAFSPPERSCLLVNLLAEEVDLSVLVDGRAVLLRTVRVPPGEEDREAARRVAAEINRTLVVAQQIPGGPAERIYLFGGPDEHAVLVEQMATDVTVPFTVLDPFEGVDGSQIEMPGNAGRFASLLGMVQDEAAGTHAIDFLHPRRPPRKGDRRRLAWAGAAVLGLLLAAGGYSYWDALSALKATNRDLAQQRKKLDESLKRSRQQTQLYQTLRGWQESEIVWLDELRELSERLPPSRDLLVQRLTISGGRGGGGVIELQGVVRDAAVVARIDRELHDEYHVVSSKRVGDYPQGHDYSWLFERTILVSPRDKSPSPAAEQVKP